jgi:fructose-1,6-bisphosphatase/inositol monophosphatase family enzyme
MGTKATLKELVKEAEKEAERQMRGKIGEEKMRGKIGEEKGLRTKTLVLNYLKRLKVAKSDKRGEKEK